MENNLSIDGLKERLTQLDEERAAILKLLELWGQVSPLINAPKSAPNNSGKQSNTISGRIVDAAIELIHSLGKQATNKEILEFVTKKGLSLGKTTDQTRNLSAILSNEANKPNGKLKSVARGVYDIK